MSVYIYTFSGIDQQTYDHSKALITSWPPGYTETNDIPGRLVYFSGEIPKWYNVFTPYRPKEFTSVYFSYKLVIRDIIMIIYPPDFNFLFAHMFSFLVKILSNCYNLQHIMWSDVIFYWPTKCIHTKESILCTSNLRNLYIWHQLYLTVTNYCGICP